MPKLDITERLRFDGRYGAESRDQCTIRKNAEREEAAGEIEHLRRAICWLTDHPVSTDEDPADIRAVIDAARAAQR